MIIELSDYLHKFNGRIKHIFNQPRRQQCCQKGNPRFTQEAIRANRAVVELLGRIGTEHDATSAQIALAWLLAQKPWIVPIPGSRKLHRLDENIGSANIILTTSDLNEIEEAMTKITVIGHRY